MFDSTMLTEKLDEISGILPYCARQAIVSEGNSEDAVNVAAYTAIRTVFDEDIWREVILGSDFHDRMLGMAAEYIKEHCQEVGGWEWEEYRW